MSDIRGCCLNSQAMNILNKMHDILQCISHKSSHCRMKQVRRFVKDKYKVRYTYCGALAFTGRSNSQNFKIMYIQTYVNYILNLEFNAFNFEWRRNECNKHSVIIRQNNSALFCGKRLPWTMMVHDTKTSIQLRLEKYRSYKLAMFYSSYQPEWFERQSTIYRIYKTSSSFWNLPLSNLNNKNIELTIHYVHLLVDPWQKIAITLIWSHLAGINTTVVIHDGPGHLSPHLRKFDQNSPDGNYNVKTATFSAFIKIRMLIANNINLKIRTLTEPTHFQSCVMRRRYIRLSSNDKKNRACLAEFNLGQSIVPGYGLLYVLKINIHTFKFTGPQIIVDEGNHNCHYGGIYIDNLNGEDNMMIPLCDSRDDFILNSKVTKMKVLIVFYARYSAGKIQFNFEYDDCFPTYLELTDYPSYNTRESAVMDDSHICQYYICAPKETEGQGRCVVKAISQVNKDFGTVDVAAAVVDTLSSCVPEYYGNISKETLYFAATISERWPLEKPEVIDINVTVNEYFRRVFAYFYNGTIILPEVCAENRQKQLMIRIEQSVCLVRSNGLPYTLGVGYIHAMSQSCYNVLQTIKHYRENASYLIHKEGNEIHKGGILYTKYEGPCSTRCRQYQVVLLVLKQREDRIYEHRAYVGEKLSLGFLHNGFRLTVIPPSLGCECDIDVEMRHFVYQHYKNNYKRKPPTFLRTPFGELFQKQ